MNMYEYARIWKNMYAWIRMNMYEYVKIWTNIYEYVRILMNISK